MKIVRSIGELKLEGAVGLVPTMGALHDGHIALFRAARAENEVVVASLFVNPAQFDEQTDFAAYARDADGLALSSRNVRLSDSERERALALPRALHAAIGSLDPVATARAQLNGMNPDYVELLDLDGALLLAAAVRVGSTRLIDNVLL